MTVLRRKNDIAVLKRNRNSAKSASRSPRHKKTTSVGNSCF